MDYDNLSEKSLAQLVATRIGMPEASALRAVQSDDPDLGRPWAIEMLSAQDRHAAYQQQLTHSMENIGRALARS